MKFTLDHVPAPKTNTQFSIEVKLIVVTPILGGGVKARELDDVDVIRVPTIRGHLRFWWRALADDAASAEELFARECRIWGGTGHAGESSTSRSRVSVSVLDVDRDCGTDTSEIDVADDDAYALWPARGTTTERVAPRWKPGVTFRLRVKGPDELKDEIQRALSAWLCFGGYGSRTRRGLGKVAPNCELSRSFAPTKATKEELTSLFGEHLFRSPSARSDWPRLRGVVLALGQKNPNGEKAWQTSLNWVKEFRQGSPSGRPLGTHDPNYARVAGANNRPSISNWPEADKVRQLSHSTTGHTPRHNSQPVLPKASLGLPVISQFQRKSRNNTTIREPRDYELQWVDQQGNAHDRLASPLIVGAMPIAKEEGTLFIPFALWLGRGYPENGQVVVVQNRIRLNGSAADFDELVASGDTAQFAPLMEGQKAASGIRMRTAFFGWLSHRYSNVNVLS